MKSFPVRPPFTYNTSVTDGQTDRRQLVPYSRPLMNFDEILCRSWT